MDGNNAAILGPLVGPPLNMSAAALQQANVLTQLANNLTLKDINDKELDNVDDKATLDRIALKDAADAKLRNTENATQSKFQWMKDAFQTAKDFTWRNSKWLSNVARGIRWFAVFMKTIFLFFPIIIIFRMLIGFFKKPVEFIMLGLVCLILPFIYVIYSIFSVPPFSIFPLMVWFFIRFFIFFFIPWIFYVSKWLIVIVLVYIFSGVLYVINIITGGLLQRAWVCEGSVNAWYKIPSNHVKNNYHRGFMCAKPCMAGYEPDEYGDKCVSIPKISPSFCPKAEVMRLFTVNRYDINYYFRDYPTLGNMKYLLKTPAGREKLLLDHYMKKKTFIDKCTTVDKNVSKINDYDFISMNICSSTDILEKNTINGLDPFTVNKIRRVCNQAYCNTKTNYPFCSNAGAATIDNNTGDFWKKLIKIFIMIMVLLIIMFFSLKYISGNKMKNVAPEN